MIFKRKYIIGLILLLFFQFLLLFNSRFTFWPEMILYPYLMQNNFELYSNIINPYFPLLSIVLEQYFNVVGLTILNLKFFTFLVILFTNLLIFIYSYKISKNIIKSFLASILYIFLQYSYGGNGLWFELFLAPFLLSGICLFYLYNKLPKFLVLSGFLLGLAVLIKQNAIFFYIAPIFYLIFNETSRIKARGFLLSNKRFKDILLLIFPGIIVAAIFFIYLYQKEILKDFWDWAIILPLSFSKQNGFVQLPAIRQYLFIFFPLICLVFKEKIQNWLFWALVIMPALLFAFPRYEDFHLQVLVAFGSLLSIKLNKKILLIFTIVALLLFTRTSAKLIFKEDRFVDKETLDLSKKVKDYDSVYLLNSPELTYFFSNKLPPKIWATNYPWYFEQPKFEEKFIQNLAYESTNYIVIGEPLGGEKYALGNYLPDKLLSYISNNYTQKEKYGNYQIWIKK